MSTNEIVGTLNDLKDDELMQQHFDHTQKIYLVISCGCKQIHIGLE